MSTEPASNPASGIDIDVEPDRTARATLAATALLSAVSASSFSSSSSTSLFSSSSNNGARDTAVIPQLTLPYQLNTFQLTSIVGQGSFGVVYAGNDTCSGQLVVLKFGKKSAIQHETRVLIHLNALGAKCVPAPIWYGRLEGKWSYLMMERMGKPLRQWLREVVSVKYKTVLQLGIQMMECLRQVHFAGIIHADINLNNWMTGFGTEVKENLLYLVDFGIARPLDYQSPLANTVPASNASTIATTLSASAPAPASVVAMVGTPMYVSAYIHSGKQPDRVDDVIATMHCLCHLYFGTLEWEKKPWHEMPKLKMELMHHPDVPVVFRDMLRELYTVYEERARPNYEKYVEWMREEWKHKTGCEYPPASAFKHMRVRDGIPQPPLEWV